MGETRQERYKRIKNKYKYYPTERLLGGMRTDYIFIRDAYKQLEHMLEEQWIRIEILDKRLGYANTKRRRKQIHSKAK